MALRVSKAVLVFAIAPFYMILVLNNITDYGSNYEFVRHVLMMDSTLPGNHLLWRAVNSPLVHTAFYIGSQNSHGFGLHYTQQERDDMRLSSKIPPRTLVWLARYLGRNTIACGSLEAKHRGPFGVYHGRISTFIVGSLSLQIMTVHSNSGRLC
jgi:hypothetical protein